MLPNSGFILSLVSCLSLFLGAFHFRFTVLCWRLLILGWSISKTSVKNIAFCSRHLFWRGDEGRCIEVRSALFVVFFKREREKSISAGLFAYIPVAEFVYFLLIGWTIFNGLYCFTTSQMLGRIFQYEIRQCRRKLIKKVQHLDWFLGELVIWMNRHKWLTGRVLKLPHFLGTRFSCSRMR